jgi:hypothetical protein
LKLSQGEVHDFSEEVQKFSGMCKTGGAHLPTSKSGHGNYIKLKYSLSFCCGKKQFQKKIVTYKITKKATCLMMASLSGLMIYSQ